MHTGKEIALSFASCYFTPFLSSLLMLLISNSTATHAVTVTYTIAIFLVGCVKVVQCCIMHRLHFQIVAGVCLICYLEFYTLFRCVSMMLMGLIHGMSQGTMTGQHGISSLLIHWNLLLHTLVEIMLMNPLLKGQSEQYKNVLLQ